MHRKIVFNITIGALILAVAPLVQAAMETDFIVSPAAPNSLKPGIFLYEAKPGDTINDTVLIKNTSQESYELNIYGTDRTVNEEGSKAFKKGWEEMTEMGPWIEVEQHTWTLENEETKTIPFQITVPVNTPHGVYQGGIAFEKFFEAQGGSINTALRIIKDVEVTITDNPKEIPKLYPATFILKPFFWITLGIFICCVTYVIIAHRKTSQHEKKKH